MKPKKQLTYKKAGVDIEKGDEFIDLIAPLAKKTFRREVVTDLGSFGALFKLDIRRMKEPVLVSGTDGVGTKLKIAFMADRHDTVGIDLVAMCVNDILTSGAEPLFFLDYFATGKLHPRKAADVIRGIAEGCTQAGCSLVGGETAEMPGFYDKGEYDLSGFAVGVVDKSKIIDGKSIRGGDAVIGLSSSGVHSNGYSLVRKVFFDEHHMKVQKRLPELGKTLGEELLTPTRIYVKAMNALRGKVAVKGMAHITGGGIDGNLPRALPKKCGAVLTPGSWPVPAIFEAIMKYGNVPEQDMKNTFNMGIGYILVVEDAVKAKTISILGKAGFDAFVIGQIEKGFEGVRYGKK